MVSDNRRRAHVLLLQKLANCRPPHTTHLALVVEVVKGDAVRVDFEALAVKAKVVFAAADIVDGDAAGVERAVLVEGCPRCNRSVSVELVPLSKGCPNEGCKGLNVIPTG